MAEHTSQLLSWWGKDFPDTSEYTSYIHPAHTIAWRSKLDISLTFVFQVTGRPILKSVLVTQCCVSLLQTSASQTCPRLDVHDFFCWPYLTTIFQEYEIDRWLGFFQLPNLEISKILPLSSPTCVREIHHPSALKAQASMMVRLPVFTS